MNLPLWLKVRLWAVVVVIVVERPESEAGDVNGTKGGCVTRRHYWRWTIVWGRFRAYGRWNKVYLEKTRSYRNEKAIILNCHNIWRWGSVAWNWSECRTLLTLQTYHFSLAPSAAVSSSCTRAPCTRCRAVLDAARAAAAAASAGPRLPVTATAAAYAAIAARETRARGLMGAASEDGTLGDDDQTPQDWLF